MQWVKKGQQKPINTFRFTGYLVLCSELWAAAQTNRQTDIRIIGKYAVHMLFESKGYPLKCHYSV